MSSCLCLHTYHSSWAHDLRTLIPPGMSSLSPGSCPPETWPLFRCSRQSLFLQRNMPWIFSRWIKCPSVAIASTNCWLPLPVFLLHLTSLEIETSPYSLCILLYWGLTQSSCSINITWKCEWRTLCWRKMSLKLKEDIYYLCVMKNFLFYKNAFLKCFTPTSHHI